VAQRLNLPLALVLPVRLCPVPGPLYTALVGYKESAVDVARQHFARIVADHFSIFFRLHAPCVAASLGGEVDVVLPVPSTHRPNGASLELVEGLGDLACRAFGPPARWLPSLLRRSTGPVGHMRPHAQAFSLADHTAARGARVALLDDTYVSGARSQSAAAALRQAGARATVVIPLGRILRPDRLGAHAAYMARSRHQAEATREAPCCRCVRFRVWREGNSERR
jgi:hypothetical protein